MNVKYWIFRSYCYYMFSIYTIWQLQIYLYPTGGQVTNTSMTFHLHGTSEEIGTKVEVKDEKQYQEKHQN